MSRRTSCTPAARGPTPEAYEAQAKKLAAMFQKNFEQFADAATPEILAAAPQA